MTKVILPPPPAVPVVLPVLKPFVPLTKEWQDIVETSKKTVRPQGSK